MTAKEAVNWIINIMADIGKSEHRALWHYEQALMEIREMLETSAQPEIIRCKGCRYYEWTSNRVPDEQTWFCYNWDAETGKYDYCSYAKRREE